VQFGTLTPEGLTNVRVISRGAILDCPHVILDPAHYDAAGRCRCSDPEEQARMIREWGYSRSDFATA